MGIFIITDLASTSSPAWHLFLIKYVHPGRPARNSDSTPAKVGPHKVYRLAQAGAKATSQVPRHPAKLTRACTQLSKPSWLGSPLAHTNSTQAPMRLTHPTRVPARSCRILYAHTPEHPCVHQISLEPRTP